MALKMGHELLGPGDVGIDAGAAGPGGLGGAGAGAPSWGVGNPIAVAMSGLQESVTRFADTYDDIQGTSFLFQTQQELNQKYTQPETGLFNTRKGAAAEGIYNELIEDAKRITDKDAVRDLSARQRRRINSPLSTLFTDWGHKVADFETKQLMDHQVNTAQNNIARAIDIVAKDGNLDVSALGMAYTGIQASNIALGKMQGWDEDTIVRNTRENFGEAIVKGALAASVSDPTKAYGAVRSYKDVIPAEKYQAAISQIVSQWNNYTMQQFFDVYTNQGSGPAKQFLDSVSMAGRSAQRAASAESGGKADAVNLQDSGGTSVGLYQIHRGPSADTMSGFETWLRQHDKADVADVLKGKQGKELGDAWKELVASGRITDEDQTGFIQETHVDEAIKKLPEELRQRINASSIYQDAIWSTAIQHGVGGAAKLMNAAWKDSGTDNRLFFESLYEARKGQFARQPKHIQEAIAKRLENEKQRALEEITTDAATGQSMFPRDELILTPQKYMQAMRTMQSREREKGVQVNRIMRDLMPNAAAEFMQTGDATAFDTVEEMLVQLDDEKAFLQFKTQRAKYQELLPFMQDNAQKSFTEQQALAHAWLSQSVIPGVNGNAAAINKMMDEVTRSLQKQMTEARKSPVSYVNQLQVFKAQRGQQDPTAAPQLDPRAGQEPTEQEIASGKFILDIRENMRIQRQLFGDDPAYTPLILSSERAKELNNFFADTQIGPQEKFQEAMRLTYQYGPYSEKMFNEVGLDGGMVSAASIARQLEGRFEPVARDLFAAALLPEDAIQRWRDNPANKVTDTADARDNALVVHMNNTVFNTGLSTAGAIQAPQFERAMAKWIGMGGGDKANELAQAFDYTHTEMGFIARATGAQPVLTSAILRIPKHLNVDPVDAAYGLGRLTQEQLAELIPKLPERYEKEFALDYELAIEALKQRAVWISTDEGRRAMLFADGEMLPGRDGRAITIDVAEIAAKYSAERAEEITRIAREARAPLRGAPYIPGRMAYAPGAGE